MSDKISAKEFWTDEHTTEFIEMWGNLGITITQMLYRFGLPNDHNSRNLLSYQRTKLKLAPRPRGNFATEKARLDAVKEQSSKHWRAQRNSWKKNKPLPLATESQRQTLIDEWLKTHKVTHCDIQQDDTIQTMDRLPLVNAGYSKARFGS